MATVTNSHTEQKDLNNFKYELHKAIAADTDLPASTRAAAAFSASADAVASGYHGAAAQITGEPAAKQENNVSVAGHGVAEAQHNVQAFESKLQRQDESASAGVRVTAAAKEAGHSIAAAYHHAVKDAEQSK
jgi:hypothetical protein